MSRKCERCTGTVPNYFKNPYFGRIKWVLSANFISDPVSDPIPYSNAYTDPDMKRLILFGSESDQKFSVRKYDCSVVFRRE
jgi:hypothetical protein